MFRRVRKTMIAATMAGLLGATALATSAAPAAAKPAQTPVTTVAAGYDCAHLGYHDWGWAQINNDCGYWIFATVEVSGSNPSCVWVPPWSDRWLDFHGWPEYAYECDHH